MKKLVIAFLLCLPLTALAQMKPGIPISEVVRQAQAELATQKKTKGVSQEPKIRVEQQQNTPLITPTYDPRLAAGAGPVIYSEPRAMRTPRTARVARQPRQTTEKSSALTTAPAGTPRAASEPTPSVYRAPRSPRATNGEFASQLDYDRKFGLSLATNGLMWLMATPNLDLRLQYDKFSLVGSAAYSGWNMPEQKFWWITSLGAELRYDVIPNVYVGLMYTWFNYNIKFSGTGNQGIANAAGIVAGYKLPIGRKLALDFGIGLGYALVENERYHDQGTVFIRDERRTYGYWGLTKAQVSLVWRML